MLLLTPIGTYPSAQFIVKRRGLVEALHTAASTWPRPEITTLQPECVVAVQRLLKPIITKLRGQTVANDEVRAACSAIVDFDTVFDQQQGALLASVYWVLAAVVRSHLCR